MKYWHTILAAAATAALLGGCGSNFEWFPKDGTFTNSSTATTTKAGTVMKEIPFPSSAVTVKAVSDLAYDPDSDTFWLLAVTAGTADASNAPDALVQVDKAGEVLTKLDADSWPVDIAQGSTLAFDGVSFWITGAGSASRLYEIIDLGSFATLGGTYVCPATSSGLCRGIVWDINTFSFWSAASDSATLTNYQLSSGAITSSVNYSNLWSGTDVTDVSYDSANDQVFVIKGGVVLVKGASGAGLGKIGFTLPGDGRGDWDGSYLWVADNTAKTIKALFVR